MKRGGAARASLEPRLSGHQTKPLREQHLEVERRMLAGDSVRTIAKDYGVTEGTIRRLLDKVNNVRSLERVRRGLKGSSR